MLGKSMISALLASIVVIALLAACGAEDDPATPTADGSGSAATATEPPVTATEAPSQPTLNGTEWLLGGIGGADIDLQEPITLSFSDGQAGGFSGCNEYGGAFTASETGEFAMSEISQTDMACETGMDLEADYLAALSQAQRYEVIDGQRLELKDGSGTTLLLFDHDTREALDGTSWIMIELEGKLPVTDTHIRFAFNGGAVSGSAGCNDFHGEYTAGDDGSFSVTNLYWTERGCLEPEGIMEQEQTFLDALANGDTYKLGTANETFEIIDAAGRTRIVASDREEEVGTGLLDATAWVLASLDGQEVDSQPPVTIRFDASQFAGTAGCVGYMGFIETEPDGTITSISSSSYAPPCDDPTEEDDVAAEYISLLGTAKQYRMVDDMLEFLDQEGTPLFAYRPALTETGLEGTSWILTKLDGEDALPDTEVTLQFRDGHALGSGGCNSYGSPYIVSEPGVISIPPATMTAVLCEQPPGVMDQEQAFHDSLGRVRTYELTDTSLELRDSTGTALLIFKPAE